MDAKYVWKRVNMIVGGLGLAIVLAFGGFGYVMHRATSPTTDPNRYEEVVAERLQVSDAYSFLPTQIHPAAEQVAFFHQPHFLKGDDIVCLRLKMASEWTERLERELEGSGRHEVPDVNELTDLQYYPSFAEKHDAEHPLTTLPTSFRTFLFGTDLRSVRSKGNHNFLAFTAVSRELNEVVYYANNW